MKRKRLFLLNDQTAPRINTELACEIGLNESIVLLQFEFWQSISEHFYEDKYWFYNSMQEIRETFKFWSVETVKRTVGTIVNRGYVHTGNFNKSKMDRTMWYSLNFEELAKLKSIKIDGLSQQENVMISDSVKLTQCTVSNCANGECQIDTMESVKLTLSSSIQRDLTERSTETTDRLTASESVGQSVSLPASMPHEQGIQKEVSDLIALCKVNNKSVALVIQAGLKSHSPEYVRLQIEYVNDKCKSQRNYRSMLDKAIENKDGKNWGQAYADDKEITARERDAAADKARRANDTSNAIKSLRLHSGKETAVTITLGQNVTGTADGEARESKISEFLSSIKPERVESLKSDFLKSAPTLIRKKHRAQGFDSLLVKTAFESYINKEVLHEAA